ATCVCCACTPSQHLRRRSQAVPFLHARVQKYKIAVASVAPQVLASLAAYYGTTDLLGVYARLVTYLKSLGFHHVLDTAVSTELSLLHAAEEFCERWRSASSASSPGAGAGTRRSAWQAPPASTAQSSTSIEWADGVTPPTPAEQAAAEATCLPLLASACPGWVCYAEKAVPQALPYVSHTKSPQQIQGTLVKQLLSVDGLVPGVSHVQTYASVRSADEVLHVAVMACYDKKLEASRRDFYWERAAAKETDVVLTTSEIVNLLQEAGVSNLMHLPPSERRGLYARSSSSAPCAPACAKDDDVMSAAGGGDAPVAEFAWARSAASIPQSALEKLLCGVTCDGAALVGASVLETSSDGYAAVILRYASHRLHGTPLDSAVAITPGKNVDFRELTIAAPLAASAAGKAMPPLKFAIAYGFRNIQTIMTRMRTGKCAYDYVEVMACPSGCVNGGGQARGVADESPGTSAASAHAAPAPAAAAANKERLANMIAQLAAREVRSPWSSEPCAAVQEALGVERGVAPLSSALSVLLRTRYHAVPPMQSASALKW
ncbi:hypothetical protein EON66_06235, partial [archaeon]